MNSGSLAVDVHTHWMPLDLSVPVGAEGEHWPRLVQTGDDVGEIRLGGRSFRTVARNCWDPVARLRELDRRGIDVEVLLPVPVTIDYTADPRAAVAYARAQNDQIALVVGDSGGRFVGYGSVPLQDPTLAEVELRRAIKLGLTGVEIGASVRGRELSAPELRPFFRAAAEIGARIFVHPLDGGGGLDRCGGPLEAFGIGMLTDTALAATALTFGGVLDDAVDLVVCLAHGGGSFAWCYERLLVRDLYGRDAADAERRRLEVDRWVRRLHVDSVVFSPAHLVVLAECFGSAQVAFGSDHPFIASNEPDVVERARLAGLWSDAQVHDVRSLNAVPLMGTT